MGKKPFDTVVTNLGVAKKKRTLALQAVRIPFTIQVLSGGAPVQGVLVKVHKPNSSEIIAARTNSNGEAIFFDLQENVQYNVSARGNGVFRKSQQITFSANAVATLIAGPAHFVAMAAANSTTNKTATVLVITRDSIYQTPICGQEVRSDKPTKASGIYSVMSDTLGESLFEYEFTDPTLSVVFTITTPNGSINITQSLELNDNDFKVIQHLI